MARMSRDPRSCSREKRLRPFSVSRIDHLVLRVKDLEAILGFYVDLLGCPVEQAKESIGLYQLQTAKSTRSSRCFS